MQFQYHLILPLTLYTLPHMDPTKKTKTKAWFRRGLHIYEGMDSRQTFTINRVVLVVALGPENWVAAVPHSIHWFIIISFR
jgi:hypothetical protein